MKTNYNNYGEEGFQVPRSKGEFHSVFMDSLLSNERLAKICNRRVETIKRWRNGEETPWPWSWQFLAHIVFVEEHLEQAGY
tara:strand:+ start:515 stop:757 length:243 start_codon:yes stop_codon:yes gene_type:complete